MKEVKRYTDNDGRRMVVVDDGPFVIVGPEEAFQKTGMLSGAEASVGRRFDPMQPTVGSLVGVRLGASQEHSNQVSGCNRECRQLHDAMGLRCSGILCTGVNANSTARFDPRLPTVGDLVGSRTVEAAASEPPVVHRIGGVFNAMQVTVGDLVTKTPRVVRGRGIISAEPDDILVHPRRIRD